MANFFQKNKVFIIVILATVILIGGGVLLLGKGGKSSSTPTPVSASILIPEGVYKTSGFVDGSYLPASPSATVNLVEFGDYECPACVVYAPFVKQILTNFAGKVTYVFRNYPLPQHKNAYISSYAVEAAGAQGKYWEMQEKMYSTQAEWSTLTDPAGFFEGYAKELGLNTNQFTADMNSQKVKDDVQRDVNDGNKVALTETPTFYINGVKVALSGDPNQLADLIQAELSK